MEADRQLAHAGVVALERMGKRERVQQYADDASVAVRMAVLLVQRRWTDPLIEQFLDDTELKIVTEAARAIHDLPLTTGLTKLAGLAERYRSVSGDGVIPLMRRIINANLRAGGPSDAQRVIAIAVSDSLPLVVRQEAISALAAWRGPITRDRVTGFWQPIEARDIRTVRETVQKSAGQLLTIRSTLTRRWKAGIATSFFVDGRLPLLEIMQCFKVTSEVRGEGIGVRVPMLIGICLLLLLSFTSLSRLLGLRSLTLSEIRWIELNAQHFQFGRSTSPINSEMQAVTS